MLPMHRQIFMCLPLDERCTATLQIFSELELLPHSNHFVGESLAALVVLGVCRLLLNTYTSCP